MTKWKLKINGEYLRELIKSEADGFDILLELYRTIKSKFIAIKDEDIKYEFEDLLYTLESDVEGGKEHLIQWINSEGYNLVEIVDDRLTQFYDLCDRHRIWVTV